MPKIMLEDGVLKRFFLIKHSNIYFASPFAVIFAIVSRFVLNVEMRCFTHIKVLF